MIWKSASLKAAKDDYRRATRYFDDEMRRVKKEISIVEKSMEDESSNKKDIYASADRLLYRAKMLGAEMKAFYTVFETRSR